MPTAGVSHHSGEKLRRENKINLLHEYFVMLIFFYHFASLLMQPTDKNKDVLMIILI